ncbi:MAG: ABC transporter ATP-binding protein [Cyanobacteriota bacterium]|jgi:lipopolysaccharide transport system ATP-binding protein
MANDNDLVIRVEGLGKKYLIQHEQPEDYKTLRDSLSHHVTSLARWANPFTLSGQIRRARRHAAHERARGEEDFWALKDVNFEIRRGDRVGIIGRNGAGKSTLLKILSRITEPTTGRVEILGRVASLLEVGTGFHPELTGRENIFLNGAILGMTRREIKSKFDEIVEFAEVDKFLDTPVKRYSSGMYVRLAFAVAAHLEPEILVVDEVLAVGDASFQKKCLGKMQDVADTEARTVLFVSHNMIAVNQLCNYAIAMRAGTVAMRGEPQQIINAYLNDDRAPVCRAEWESLESSPGDDHFRIRKIEVLNAESPDEGLRIDKPMMIRLFYDMLRMPTDKMLSIDISLHLKTADGFVVLVSGNKRDLKQMPVNYDDGRPIRLVDTCMIPANLLNDTTYTIDAYVLSNSNCHHAIAKDVILFTVSEIQREALSLWKAVGVVRPQLDWTTEQLRG